MFATQAALDTSVRAIETRDFALYASVNAIPSVLIGDTETLLLADEAALRRNFESLCGLADAASGRRIERIVTAEQAVGACLVQATVLTRIWDGGRLPVEPFHTLITWRRTDAGWVSVAAFNPVRTHVPVDSFHPDWRPWSHEAAGPLSPALRPQEPE